MPDPSYKWELSVNDRAHLQYESQLHQDFQRIYMDIKLPHEETSGDFGQTKHSKCHLAGDLDSTQREAVRGDSSNRRRGDLSPALKSPAPIHMRRHVFQSRSKLPRDRVRDTSKPFREISRLKDAAISRQINLRLILVSGKTKEFLYSPNDSAADIAKHVYDNWPMDWEEEQVSSPNILRLIYQGRFLHGNVTLGALKLPLGKTTVMHLVARETLPEPNSQGQRNREKTGESNCCVIL
ncbi:hypothetical protein XELAEV_18013740mg [Xenopus laevis]|uniref:Ubiquitin-like protein 3 n=1 Tax=Xenopus laevis TaxID=8355 RepID=A0A974DQ85_XENLA|nr:hypothetical protein XELAEV_18013740mg [Xenopus laevis]